MNFKWTKILRGIYKQLANPGSVNTGTQPLIRNSEKRKAPKTESFFMEVVCKPKLAFGPNMPGRDIL
jgi:hypothetical protein